jgi:hypothetical protein
MTASTFSVFAISLADALAPRNCMTEVRAMTRRSLAVDSCAMSASVIPSAK